MKSVALSDPVPTEKLHAIVRANGFLMEAYRGGLRIKSKPSLFGRIRKTVSKLVPHRLTLLLRQDGNASEIVVKPLYKEKDLVKRYFY
jgi:hypothetical protein